MAVVTVKGYRAHGHTLLRLKTDEIPVHEAEFVASMPEPKVEVRPRSAYGLPDIPDTITVFMEEVMSITEEELAQQGESGLERFYKKLDERVRKFGGKEQ